MNEKEFLQNMKKTELDLSRDEDLSIALMNLISLEEHLEFSAAKSGKEKYLEMLKQVRGLRKKFLEKFVKPGKAEEWCVSKHLLSASMRLFETGAKELDSGKKQESQEYFDQAFMLYSMFFALTLGVFEERTVERKVSKVSEFVKKIVDCCKE